MICDRSKLKLMIVKEKLLKTVNRNCFDSIALINTDMIYDAFVIIFKLLLNFFT